MLALLNLGMNFFEVWTKPALQKIITGLGLPIFLISWRPIGE